MTNIQTWPLNIDFTIAVQNPHLCFADPELKNASTAKNSRGRVFLWSGNFATVYKLTTETRAWAVRCFTRTPQADVQRRYQLISEHLSRHSIPYLVNFEFLAKGVLVKGKWYPILKMDWVDGEEIDSYIGENLVEPQVLLRLDRQLKQLQKDLQLANIAHGDLQHGNIMVDDQGELKLVDYDGMYVPMLQGSPPIEIGHPNYQPPDRALEDFGDRLDEFSFEVISLSLRALAIKPELWDTFHEDNKNLIFLQHDFQEPKSSLVFQAIADIPDAEILELRDRVIRQCHDKNYSKNSAQPTLEISAKTNSINLTENNAQNSLKQIQVSDPQRLTLLVSALGLSIVALVGVNYWQMRQQRKLQIIQQPVLPLTPPSPLATAIAKAPPKLNRITIATLQTRYAEGQRDFRSSQITGSSGDRLMGQNFRDINLSGSIIERIDLRQVNFQNANLSGVAMVRVDLRGADLSNAKLIDADLTASNLSETNLVQANLLRANLTQAKLGGAILANGELMKANLSGADLNGVNLNGANLLLADLSKANLTKANLSQSNLSATNLTNTNLEGADLTSANLRSAMLNLTNLSNANLSAANLTAASLVLVELAGTNLEGANFRSATIENIGSIEASDFTNVINLDPNVRKYFCSLASGQTAITGTPTKSTLNCL
ncbi:MAG: hypothetical protein AUK48_00215 [Oscillatoriales cyanobacterium CG2_30_44_21]|nr:MAG: hypothetical protein AUK48_00215 [Oscillatoriales cyanobacterium CG2_30_44_21]